MKIYDASGLFLDIERNTLDNEGFILDITYFEVGNIVHKHHNLLKKIDAVEASEILEILESWKNIIYIRSEDVQGIFSICSQTKLSYYDSAYVYFTKKYNAALITYDKKIIEKCSKMIKIDSGN